MNDCNCNFLAEEQNKKIDKLEKEVKDISMSVEQHKSTNQTMKEELDAHKSINQTMKEELNQHKNFRNEMNLTVNRNTTFVTILITLISVFFTLVTTLITFITQSKHKVLIQDIWCTIGIIAAVIGGLLLFALFGFFLIDSSWRKKSKQF